VGIRFTVSDSDGAGSGSAKGAFEDSLDGPAPMGRAPKDSQDEPIINDALQIFGGEIEGGKGKK
jgi:hypothetical protein